VGQMAAQLMNWAPPSYLIADWISYVFNPNIQSKPSCGNKVPELSSRKFYFDISKNIKKFYRGVYSSNRESR
jgi:hypothetical protein